jgi:hypothetical protein
MRGLFLICWAAVLWSGCVNVGSIGYGYNF